MRTKLSLLFFLMTTILLAQNVAINENGAVADPSAVLDIQSNDKGLLIPRMTTVQREAIANPANGLLVFDSNTQSFWFREGAAWAELNGGPDILEDEDMDTRVTVEEQADEDRIRMYIADEEALRIEENSNGAHRFNTSALSRNLFIGHEAGLNSNAGYNTFLGFQAGRSNSVGSENLFIGYESGESNSTGDDNVFLGYQSGRVNNGSFNVFLGSRAGFANVSGDDNTFLGYHAGDSNIDGYAGTFVGHNAGPSNSSGISNTFIGQGAGFYNTSGSQNTFVGEDAGRRSRLGDRNTALGSGALGTNLSSGELGDENVALGYRAGYQLNEMATQNVLLGSQAGYNHNDGVGNILMGHQAGYFFNSGSFNVGLGFHALRSSATGNRNVAIGDSALIANQGSNNIAIGAFSGQNVEGNNNVLIGTSTGTELETSGSVFIGQLSGENTSSGAFNSFVGSLSGRYNTTGVYNSFFGHSAGDRNTRGQDNAFIGAFAGHGNESGVSNTALGFNSLFANRSGNENVAIGKDALANLAEVNNQISQSQNTAIGFQSAHIDLGNYNTTIGARSSAGNNDYNIALGFEASTNSGSNNFSDGSRSIAIGYQTRAGGQNNIAIGRNTTMGQEDNILIGANATDGFSSFNAVGIGNNVNITWPHTIILGDHADGSIAVGLGTNTPTAKLHISNDQNYQRALVVEQGALTAFEVWNNQGASVGNPTGLPPYQGLAVYGQSEFGQSIDVEGNADIHGDAVIDSFLYINTNVMPTDYRMAVDGRIACTELRVQNVIDWPDYVFEKNYELKELTEVQNYIEEFNHLPGVPSAQEIEQAGGAEVGSTQKLLLEKIEELTLYILQLHNRLEDLENQN